MLDKIFGEVDTTELPKCYLCEKNEVRSFMEECGECKDKHKEWKRQENLNHMIGKKEKRILRCEDCNNDTFTFIWEYNYGGEIGMTMCHDGFGWQLEDADMKCAVCGSKEHKVESALDIAGKALGLMTND